MHERWVEAAHRVKAGDPSLVEQLLIEIESLGYTATLDFPMNLFAKNFAQMRPSAKVLFTHRDLEAWYNSWRNVNRVLNRDQGGHGEAQTFPRATKREKQEST